MRKNRGQASSKSMCGSLKVDGIPFTPRKLEIFEMRGADPHAGHFLDALSAPPRPLHDVTLHNVMQLTSSLYFCKLKTPASAITWECCNFVTFQTCLDELWLRSYCL